MQKHRYKLGQVEREQCTEGARRRRKEERKRVESSGGGREWAPARCMLIGEQVLGLGAGG